MEANKWAILIGVNFYSSGNARPGMNFTPLNGCVEGVRRVEELLRTSFGLKEPFIYRLTATSPGPSGKQEEPQEDQSEWPTYENIINKIQEVTKKAKPNDLVYIHYSGHGAQVETAFKEFKPNEIDEALVPTDISSTGRYLRDVEIAYLLEAMADKGLIVTLVLDCCHSGGANRGSSGLVRGIKKVDNNKLESDKSLLASQEELKEAWRKSRAGGGRTVRVENHWLLETRRYTFIAACRAHEYAAEHIFDGKAQGLLTHTMIDALKNSPSHLTYYELWNLVAMKVREHNDEQNVILGGEADRLFFASGRRELFYVVPITKVTETKQGTIVEMKVGAAQGILEGAGIDVWPSSCFDFKPSERLALLRVTEVENSALKAEVTEHYGTPKLPLQSGFLARPHVVPRMNVQLVRPEPLGAYQDAITKAQEAFHQHGILLSDNTADTSFRVHVKNGNYVILSGQDQQLRNPVPPLAIDVDRAAETLARRIIHLTRYYNILQLSNAERSIPDEWFSLSLEKKRRSFPEKPRLAKDKSGPATFPYSKTCETTNDEWLLLKAKNTSRKELYITVMDLDRSWAIDQIYPYAPGVIYQPLASDEVLYLPLQLTVPDGATGLIDTIKVFVTTDPTSFRWLELPELDEGKLGRANNMKPKNALEVLQESMMLPKSRKVSISAYIPTGWDTASCIVETPKHRS
ncbi:hypothetical protein AOL_s00110g303 [Orbilia oligospora ATCC 24927]|uniref:Peptidase C14 caspase domain-containing protein n=1 Tax=Arthrobotrys oligospora (strain ATCC 24927 / CBS 115.81 / DSM 1491) TaxID=756982 RepID=G1XLD3_ARTOA|nr:hypothetical protein AOL_s00110g303 [Orbilia oligospora ATCC 24927]EGX46139.1 hypothetical protein AOL_s00110g303 [Orbilia oligospora ATCC 24927]